MWGEGGERKEVGVCREEGGGVCVKGRQCKKGKVLVCAGQEVVGRRTIS